ncbi:hypothetical protein BGI30_07960 [Snodgrassella alvi]|uniref:DUF7716 domain-containing protein n=1 Tax=Snodgrassella alvi TaxID=1196083 RepID=UPI000CBBFED2|nr:hypothetical protein [Snodgrassella alvi]PIT08762.1 hypothetical protein BGI30_07960 [Snodgrassella alvi]PIT60401.1 hypothetical protein BHC59_00210 [Snodgrassella alvi]
MITIKGLADLIAHNVAVTESKWYFVDKKFNNSLKDDILNSNYYIADDDEEEFDLEDNIKYKTFLDSATFQSIIYNKLEHHPNATTDQLLDAIIYYLKEDDFLD